MDRVRHDFRQALAAIEDLQDIVYNGQLQDLETAGNADAERSIMTTLCEIAGIFDYLSEECGLYLRHIERYCDERLHDGDHNDDKSIRGDGLHPSTHRSDDIKEETSSEDERTLIKRTNSSDDNLLIEEASLEDEPSLNMPGQWKDDW